MTKTKSLPQTIFLILALIAVSFQLYTLLTYWDFAGYLDHAESLITVRAWQFANGAPLYQPSGDGVFLIVPYGPVSFMANAFFLSIFGGSIDVSKIGGMFSAVLALLAFAVFVYRAYGTKWLGFGILLFVCMQLATVPFTFWSRPDPQAILLISMALLGTTLFAEESCARRWSSAIAVALAIGLAINMKVHFFVFLFPLVSTPE